MSEPMSIAEMIDESRRERDSGIEKYKSYWLEHAIDRFNLERRVPLVIYMTSGFHHRPSHCNADTLVYVRDTLASKLLAQCWDVKLTIAPETWWRGPRILVEGWAGKTFDARDALKVGT